MSNSINIDQSHSSGVSEASHYYEVRDSSRSSLYSLIKKVVEKGLVFFHLKSSHIIISHQTNNPLRDRTSCYAVGETEVHMLSSKRDELKMRLAPMKRELVTLREKLIDDRKDIERAYRYDRPYMDSNEATRLGTQLFETYLLADHPDDDRRIYRTVTRANRLSNKIASLELDLESYNARLENYNRRTEFINYEYGIL